MAKVPPGAPEDKSYWVGQLLAAYDKVAELADDSFSEAEEQARAVIAWLAGATAHGLNDHPTTKDIVARLHGVLRGADLHTRPDQRRRAASTIREHAERYQAAAAADRLQIAETLAQHLALGLEPKLRPLLHQAGALDVLGELLAKYAPAHAKGKLTVAAIMAELGVRYGAFDGTIGSRHPEQLRKSIEESLRVTTE